MESSQSGYWPTSILLCNENAASSDDEAEEETVEDAYDDEYIGMLLDREITSGELQMQGFLQNSWIQGARLEGIQYILRTRELLGFGTKTAYASVTYLDRFLSKIPIDAAKSWQIRLLSISCLSLAAKIEEIKVPALSEFCLDYYNFESSVIQRMELLVLDTLGWKMGSITPYDFIQFFANKFSDNSQRSKGLSRTVDQVILRGTRDPKITCYKPSEIAAAATLVALSQGLTRDSLKIKICPLTSTYSFKIENIISCYNLYQEMEKLSKGTESPYSSPIKLHGAEHYEGQNVV